MKQTRIPPSHQRQTTVGYMHKQLAKELNWGLNGGQKQISELAVKAGATLK